MYVYNILNSERRLNWFYYAVCVCVFFFLCMYTLFCIEEVLGCSRLKEVFCSKLDINCPF